MIGETLFTHGPDQIELAQLDHPAFGIELRVSFNHRFFIEQRFEEPVEAARAALMRRREYEESGWTINSQSHPATDHVTTAAAAFADIIALG